MSRPVVLVVQNDGYVVEVVEAIVGEADVIFIDWSEVEGRLNDGIEAADIAAEVSRLKTLAPDSLYTRDIIEGWTEACEDAGYDPDTGIPLP
jgi:hypothetical protein